MQTNKLTSIPCLLIKLMFTRVYQNKHPINGIGIEDAWLPNRGKIQKYSVDFSCEVLFCFSDCSTILWHHRPKCLNLPNSVPLFPIRVSNREVESHAIHHRKKKPPSSPIHIIINHLRLQLPSQIPHARKHHYKPHSSIRRRPILEKVH